MGADQAVLRCAVLGVGPCCVRRPCCLVQQSAATMSYDPDTLPPDAAEFVALGVRVKEMQVGVQWRCGAASRAHPGCCTSLPHPTTPPPPIHPPPPSPHSTTPTPQPPPRCLSWVLPPKAPMGPEFICPPFAELNVGVPARNTRMTPPPLPLHLRTCDLGPCVCARACGGVCARAGRTRTTSRAQKPRCAPTSVGV